MENLSIWKGNVLVYPVDPKDQEKQLDNEALGNLKYNECIHRSQEQVTEMIRTCCSSREETAFKCLKLNVFPLQSNRCAGCPEYQKK